MAASGTGKSTGQRALTQRARNRHLPQMEAIRTEDPAVARALSTIAEHLRLYEGDGSAPKERFVTIQELEDSGLIKSGNKGGWAYIAQVLGKDVAQKAGSTANPTLKGTIKKDTALGPRTAGGSSGAGNPIEQGKRGIIQKLSDIGNVNVAKPAQGDFLYYDGGNWKNFSLFKRDNKWLGRQEFSKPIVLRALQEGPEVTEDRGYIWMKDGSPTTLWFTSDDGTETQITSTSGFLSNVVEDTSPQLGGDLDGNGNNLLLDSGDYLQAGALTATDLTLRITNTNGLIWYPGTTSGGWARGIRFLKQSDSSALLGFGALGTNEAVTSFNVGFGSNWYSSDSVLQVTSSGVDVEYGSALAIYDSSNADSASFAHNGTNFVGTFTNTTNFNLLGGIGVGIFDSTGNDYGLFSHDGTDFKLTLNNTGNFIISGGNDYVELEDMDLVLTDGGSSKAHILVDGQTEGRLRLYNGSNWGITIKGVANAPQMGAYHAGSLNVVGWADANGNAVQSSVGNNGVLTQFDFANEILNHYGNFRVYDSGATDYLVAFHNGSSGYLDTGGTGGGNLVLRADGNTAAWAASANGNFYIQNDLLMNTNNKFLYGRDTGGSLQTVIGVTANDHVQIGDTSLNQIICLNPIKILEQASADSDSSGYGQIWVKNTTPNELWFTDDAGNDVQLGTGGGSSTVETKYKTADETVTSSTTLQNDDHLASFTLDAAGVYEISGTLIVYAGAVCGIKIGLSASQTPQAYYAGVHGQHQTATFVADTIFSGATTTNLATALGATYALQIYGIVRAHATNAGTLTLQWAQISSNPGGLTFRAGSCMHLRKLN